MSTTQDREENLPNNPTDRTLDASISKLSLSSQTIHADDFLNQGQDVAPPLHLSTTFRYNKNPDALVSWSERDVSPALKGT